MCIEINYNTTYKIIYSLHYHFKGTASSNCLFGECLIQEPSASKACPPFAWFVFSTTHIWMKNSFNQAVSNFNSQLGEIFSELLGFTTGCWLFIKCVQWKTCFSWKVKPLQCQ